MVLEINVNVDDNISEILSDFKGFDLDSICEYYLQESGIEYFDTMERYFKEFRRLIELYCD